MIKRILKPQVLDLAKEYPVVAIIGPRQSGKTTMAQACFPKHQYVTLEDVDTRNKAMEDPRAFLEKYRNKHGIILDEFQNAPDILSYIQTYVDREKPLGYFILTGSQNFLVMESISQTLAGRIAIFTLLPLSIAELTQAKLLPDKIEDLIFKGCYPQVQSGERKIGPWFTNYTMTYLERDVRQTINVGDLSKFRTFMALCAGRIGQLLNYSQLSNDAGISVSTVERWLSLLEATYIVRLVQPYYKNITRRLVKTPKLYFYDTGLACFLLEIEGAEQVYSHYLRGGLIESFIMSDLTKQYCNSYRIPKIYFRRDRRGNEIDCVLEKQDQLIPIEIKGSKTSSEGFFENLDRWAELNEKVKASKPIVIFAGNDSFRRDRGTILSWQDAGNLITDLYKS